MPERISRHIYPALRTGKGTRLDKVRSRLRWTHVNHVELNFLASWFAAVDRTIRPCLSGATVDLDQLVRGLEIYAVFLYLFHQGRNIGIDAKQRSARVAKDLHGCLEGDFFSTNGRRTSTLPFPVRQRT